MVSRTAPKVRLSGGIEMPQIGFGLFQLNDHDECRRCVSEAIECGYRLFDTASAYFNEEALGEAAADAVRCGTVKRNGLFLTTKVWLQDYGEKETRISVENSMKKMRTDYIDLVLLHQPFGRWKEAWKALEIMQEEGSIRAIGTSNFTKQKMKELFSFANVMPQLNQMEMHPFYSEGKYAAWLREKNIQTQAWGPLAEGQRGIFTDSVLTDIGNVHGKTAVQTALRWNLQKGNVIIPRSTKKEHMKENLDILDFTLSENEMERIDTMDLGHSEIIDFENPATERLLMKCRIHD